MNSDIAIRVEGLSKKYHIGHQSTKSGTTFREALMQGAHNLARTGRDMLHGRALVAGDTVEEFWALRDVSFDIQRGEAVGVVGRNGAGKSTLLKVLSRITEPTKGRAQINGRIASMLEVGTGFHPELSGRENVYLNGAILGMTRAEITRKFDEIVDFAEVDNFIDTPVKRYSSGMYVRLAFGVAAHLDPEIMVIDEVLAVGDAKFQQRCLGKMKEVSTQGRTVLFVSHNMLAVQKLCSRVVWLDTGRIKADGNPHAVISEYLHEGVAASRERVWDNAESAPGNGAVAIARLAIEPLHAGDHDRLTVATGARLIFEYWNRSSGAALNLSLHVYSSDDTLVLNAVPLQEREWFGKPFPIGRFRCICELPPHLLNADRYRVELLVVQDQTRVIYQDECALAFELDDVITESAWNGRFPGVVRPLLNWTTERLS